MSTCLHTICAHTFADTHTYKHAHLAGEPINLQTINLGLIPKAYGTVARDLLVLHLQHEYEHRPSASALKENMLYQLASAGRHVVHLLAEASAAEAQAAADTCEALMTPRRIHVPQGLERTLDTLPPHVHHAPPQDRTQGGLLSAPDNGNGSVRSEVSSVVSADSRPMSQTGFEQPQLQTPTSTITTAIATTATTQQQLMSTPVLSSIKQAQPPMPVTDPAPVGLPPPALNMLKFASIPSQDAGAADLGIKLIAGDGGEMGAWKISELEAGKPAALSNEIRVGNYLWEIDGKVIFGMPSQFINSLFRAKPGSDVRLGLKEGLGLPIRHVVLRRGGAEPAASAVPGSAPSLTENQLQTPSKEEQSVPVSAALQSEGEAGVESSMDSRASEALVSALTAQESPAATSSAATSAKSPLASFTAQVTGAATPTLGESSIAAKRTSSTPEEPLHPPISSSTCDELQREEAVRTPSLPPVLLTHSPLASNETPSSAGNDLPAHSPSKLPVVDGEQARRASPAARSLESNQLARHSPLARPADIDLGNSSSTSTRWAHDWRAGAGASDAQDQSIAPAEAGDAASSIMPVVGVATIAGDGEYSGELLDGKPFGRGTATWPNQGHTYVGEWRGGVMHGQGTATYLNGDRYDGEWVQGKRSGLGRYAHGSGDVYEGLWSNERKHGLGVDTFADGRGYRGEFRDNKFAGIGSYFTVDGAVYQVRNSSGRAPV